MAQNVEIKARVADPDLFRNTATALTKSNGEVIHQTDTFYTVPKGRLKLRDFGDGRGELIRYQRPDASGPKVSDYAISRTNDPDGLAHLLAGALPVLGVVLAGDGSIEDGQDETHHLMDQLGIAQENLVQGAYLDLLTSQNRV